MFQTTANTHIANNIADLVGNTPLLRLNKVTAGVNAEILIKLESSRAGGNVKQVNLDTVTREEIANWKPGDSGLKRALDFKIPWVDFWGYCLYPSLCMDTLSVVRLHREWS